MKTQARNRNHNGDQDDNDNWTIINNKNQYLREKDQINNNNNNDDITLPDYNDEMFPSNVDVPLMDHVQSVLFIPNITKRIQLFNQMISTASQHHTQLNFSLPIKQLINATINQGIFPTLVPDQVRFPHLVDGF